LKILMERHILKDITIKELEVVSGGIGVPGAIAGAFTAGAGYVGFEATTGGGSMTGFVSAVAAGAVAGFVSGPAGGQAVASTIIAGGSASFYGGMAAGFGLNAWNAAGTNYNR
jgi:hypothetical protein